MEYLCELATFNAYVLLLVTTYCSCFIIPLWWKLVVALDVGIRTERLGVCLCGADSCEAWEECENKPSLNGSRAVLKRTGNAVSFLDQHSSAMGSVCS